MSTELVFGPYALEFAGNHCVIWRLDGAPVNPSFYEMQYMKNMAFGKNAVAIEIFPRSEDLVNEQHQRHLWLIDILQVPNLKTGYLVDNGE